MRTKAIYQSAEVQFGRGRCGVKVRGRESETAVEVLHGTERWEGALRYKEVSSGAQKQGANRCECGGYVRRVVWHRCRNRHLTSGVSGERSESTARRG